MPWSRREFLAASVASSLALGLEPGDADEARAQPPRGPGKRPIIISANNGFKYLDDAFAFLAGGGDTLDAALRVVKGPEDDPEDDSVGLGGLPNEEGVVELDASCMHGPTRRAGSVGGVRNIKNVSLVAKAVMVHTGHVMLVGEGAERFAVASGFARENLLTERSRKVWFLWKQYHSTSDWWGPGPADPRFQAPEAGPPAPRPRGDLGPDALRRLERLAADVGIEPAFRRAAIERVLSPPTGTIHCSALNAKGEISGCTTTSGLAFKLPGRLGDSPIIGAGCYTDQDVGSAGATGSGEENIKVAGAHTIVENLRRGMAPLEAGMDALKRIARNYGDDQTRLRFVDMTYYILRKDGAYAGVSLWEGYTPERPHKIAVHDGTKRAEVTVSLFKGASRAYPPFPKLPPDETRP
ncbi:MAG TPA: N(4)-(beta-N-acetylglucosaminyl)-L-asparaginase [Haliangiales bacterium]|nr:N(4)-(beta-N-acetylglucosaminyl)-L-asparaginase [Haliangiales bacterium]